MKKKLSILLLLFSVEINGIDKNDLLQKPKQQIGNITWDRTTHQTAEGQLYEFQVNLIPGEDRINLAQMPLFSLLTGIPAIGIYGTPYNFRERHALIRVDPLFLIAALPATLSQALKKAFNMQDLENILKNKTVFAQIIINGLLNNQDARNKSYNMVFHPFGYAFTKQQFFNDNIPMGIFDSNSLRTADIASNTFSALNVNAHTPQDISPNNAKIHVENRELSTFWSAAYSLNKQYLALTYHILVNTPQQQQALAQKTQAANNLGDLLTSFALWKDSLSPIDALIIQDAIDTIDAILDGSEYLEQGELVKTLKKLTRELKGLHNKLNVFTA
ncbi:MAG: hypothetical protein WDZ41_00010 [Candidatus Babeliales bacterium]